MKTVKIAFVLLAAGLAALAVCASTSKVAKDNRHVMGHYLDESDVYTPVSTRRWYGTCDRDTCSVRDSVKNKIKNDRQ